MQLLRLDAARRERVSQFGSERAWSVKVAQGGGEAHAYVIEFEPGGRIGRHEAGFGQLFVVLAGSGWVVGEDGERTSVSAGDAAYFGRGEEHEKGSETGMRALMIQVRELASVEA